MYKVGVIGLGQIAWSIDSDPHRKSIWSHIGAYENSPHTSIRAVSSRNEGVCKKVQKQFSIPNYYTDYREMLATENLDIVSICTPISTHHDLAMACVDAGVKAIFCEKTLSFDVAEAEEMVRVCDERGVVLAVNFVRRWDSLSIHISDLLAENTIGNLMTVVAYGATALHTSTSHQIDLMCLYAGKPSWVVGDDPGGFVRVVHGVDDPGGIAMIKFESGVVGFLKGSGTSPNKIMSELDIVGEKGRIHLIGDGDGFSLHQFKETNAAGKAYESLVEVEASPPAGNERMVDAISDIVDCISSKGQPRSSGLSSLDTLRIIDGIRRSAADGNSKVLTRAAA